jgi:hypothetical protein
MRHVGTCYELQEITYIHTLQEINTWPYSEEVILVPLLLKYPLLQLRFLHHEISVQELLIIDQISL